MQYPVVSCRCHILGFVQYDSTLQTVTIFQFNQNTQYTVGQQDCFPVGYCGQWPFVMPAVIAKPDFEG